MGQTLQIRDEVLRPGFTQIPNGVLKDSELSPGDKIMYALLLSYAWQQGFCFPGQKVLGEDMGCDGRTVRRHLAALISRGLISEERRGLSKTNVYVIEPLANVYPEADRTELSAQDRTLLSAPNGSKKSDKEYTVEEDSMKNKQMLSRNPKIARMQTYLGFDHQTAKDPIPNPAKEAMFVAKMEKRGFDWERDIFPLWLSKVKQRGKFVSMQWVNEDIGKESYGAHIGDNEKARIERLRASVGRAL